MIGSDNEQFGGQLVLTTEHWYRIPEGDSRPIILQLRAISIQSRLGQVWAILIGAIVCLKFSL
jgi:hypothetical protein